MDKNMAIQLFEKIYLDKDKEDAKEIFYVLFASLISADTCIDEESCEESLDTLICLRIGLGDADVPEDFKTEFFNKIDMGMDIVRRDLVLIKNGEFGMC